MARSKSDSSSKNPTSNKGKGECHAIHALGHSARVHAHARRGARRQDVEVQRLDARCRNHSRHERSHAAGDGDANHVPEAKEAVGGYWMIRRISEMSDF